MDLKKEFIELIKEQNIDVQKVKGGGKVIFKVNGTFLYITFSKNLGTDQEEKYFLQVSEKKLKGFLNKKEGFFILLICGSLNNIFVIPSNNFLDIVKGYKPARDGNWKINIIGRREVIRIKEDYEMQLSKKERRSITNYKNKFEVITMREEAIKNIISLFRSLEKGKLKGFVEKPTDLTKVIHKVELGLGREADLNSQAILKLSKSGEGNKFEKVVLLCLKYFKFKIDEETSGKPGELDVITLDPIKIGLECRSTEKSVGVSIIDELKRHLRRYEDQNNYDRNSFKGLIICEDTTKQFNEDCMTEKVFSVKVSTFVKLVQLSKTYPISPYEFENFFSEYGSIDRNILNFITEKERKMKLRKDVMDILVQKGRPLNYYEIRTFLETRKWKVDEIEDELKNVVIELSSPLINVIRKIENKYEYIKRHPEVEDRETILQLKDILG